MSNILIVSSSAGQEKAASRGLAMHFAKEFTAKSPQSKMVERALDPHTFPHFTMDLGAGLMAPPDKVTPAQKKLADLSNELCNELVQADIVVLAVPMYTFTVPSTLKAWLEFVNRPGLTFELTAHGANGLLKNKKALLVCTRGSAFEGPMLALDFQVPFLKAILGFFGITDVTAVCAEGLAHDKAEANAALEKARGKLSQIAADWA